MCQCECGDFQRCDCCTRVRCKDCYNECDECGMNCCDQCSFVTKCAGEGCNASLCDECIMDHRSIMDSIDVDFEHCIVCRESLCATCREKNASHGITVEGKGVIGPCGGCRKIVADADRRSDNRWVIGKLREMASSKRAEALCDSSSSSEDSDLGMPYMP